jgi:hypothetical protein
MWIFRKIRSLLAVRPSTSLFADTNRSQSSQAVPGRAASLGLKKKSKRIETGGVAEWKAVGWRRRVVEIRSGLPWAAGGGDQQDFC